ncbi:MAG: phage tail tape measure protein [Treponema sp.]|jgi:TP901 family phage tail tape measure protein|nr:phage tail tape measure protein [Treponema sp.]
MAEIKTGVTLSLKDLFSQGMNKAAGAASGFAGKTLGAIDKVDKAVSGTSAKLAALGLTLSVGAAAKGIIEMDHRMTRLGISANASADQISELKRAVFDAAQASDVKIDPTHILGGLEVIIGKTNDLKYAEDNIRNIGLAIQATGENGDSIGALFSEFHNFKYSSEQISALMDDMVAQANEGAFSLADFAKAAPQLFSTLNAEGFGTAPENIKKTNAALQIINAGTKSPEKAIISFNAAIKELTDPKKQRDLRRLGIRIRDSAGNFRDFNDIMLEIAQKSENARNANYLKAIFSDSSMQAIRSYVTHGERMYKNLNDLGDTTGTLQKQSAKMAVTLQSNIKNLQTAFSRFADSNLSQPLTALTELLNNLAEDPDRLKKVFTGIAVGIGAITAIKGIAGISRFVGSLLQLKRGRINIGEALKMSSAMPVYVTNWGGMSGIGGAPELPGMGRGLGKITPGAASFLRTAGPYALFAAGVLALSKEIDKRDVAKYNIDGKQYQEWENQAKEAIRFGDRESELEARIAALNIQIPEYERLRGGFQFDPDEKFLHQDATGESRMVTLDELRDELRALQTEIANIDLPPEITQTGSNIAPQKVELGGHAVMDVNVNLSGSSPTASVEIRDNTTPFRYNSGSAVQYRRSGL